MEAVKKDSIPQLPPGRIKLTEHANNDWTATIESSHDHKTILSPEFWSHAAQNLRPYDKIQVRQDDGKFYAELLVVDVGRGWAKIKELTYVELSEKLEIVSELEVKWKGPHLKFCVIRASDGVAIKDGIADKLEAEVWLDEHLKAK